MSKPLEDLFPGEKAVLVTIKGRTLGILMNNPMSMLSAKKGKITEKLSLEDEAEKGTYRLENKELYIPNTWIYGTLLNASTNYKIGRKSSMSYIAGTVRVLPEKISLGIKDYEVNVQLAVIQRFSRIPRARPYIPKWEATFYIIYDPQYGVSSELLEHCLEDAGRRIGIGDYRPQHKGQYGTFQISKWEDVV
jgi:hypothetical protein